MSRKLDVFAHRWGLDRLAFRIWRYNPRGLLRLYRHHAFDRRLGVNTRGYSDLRYEPTPADVFREMMGKIPFDPRDFVFVDFGGARAGGGRHGEVPHHGSPGQDLHAHPVWAGQRDLENILPLNGAEALDRHDPIPQRCWSAAQHL